MALHPPDYFTEGTSEFATFLNSTMPPDKQGMHRNSTDRDNVLYVASEMTSIGLAEGLGQLVDVYGSGLMHSSDDSGRNESMQFRLKVDYTQPSDEEADGHPDTLNFRYVDAASIMASNGLWGATVRRFSLTAERESHDGAIVLSAGASVQRSEQVAPLKPLWVPRNSDEDIPKSTRPLIVDRLALMQRENYTFDANDLALLTVFGSMKELVQNRQSPLFDNLQASE